MAQPADDPYARRLFAHPRGGPTVLRMLLGAQLRRLREAKGMTREDAGYAIRASQSKMSRLELGRVGFKERDVADLLTLYEVDEQERAGLLSLARQANAQHWWHVYSDILPSWFELYVALEEVAVRIRTYELQFIPNLLQTEEYARAAMRVRHPHASTYQMERRVNLEMERQRLLHGEDAPKLWMVMDEAVLRRRMGTRSVMRAQLKRLIELNELPNVTLQIMPFHFGLGTTGGPFTILRFHEPDLPDVVYLEQLNSAHYLEKRQDIDLYTQAMDSLCAQAEPPIATTRLMEAIMGDT
jgi:transcriptional regulator with XRE-family HTH domain